MNFSGILLKCFSENLKQLTNINKMNDFSICFAFFMKTVGFCTVFIADMNSACKNILKSAFLLNLQIRHNFRQFYQRPCDSADFLKNVKNSDFALFVFFPSKKKHTL